jgi:hypothetical protein
MEFKKYAEFDWSDGCDHQAYPSRTKSSVIGARDYRQVWEFARCAWQWMCLQPKHPGGCGWVDADLMAAGSKNSVSSLVRDPTGKWASEALV